MATLSGHMLDAGLKDGEAWDDSISVSMTRIEAVVAITSLISAGSILTAEIDAMMDKPVTPRLLERIDAAKAQLEASAILGIRFANLLGIIPEDDAPDAMRKVAAFERALKDATDA